jgi:cell division protein FtsX
MWKFYCHQSSLFVDENGREGLTFILVCVCMCVCVCVCVCVCWGVACFQDRVLRNPNVTVHIHTGIVDAVGNNKNQMTALRLKDTRSGSSDVGARGLCAGVN